MAQFLGRFLERRSICGYLSLEIFGYHTLKSASANESKTYTLNSPAIGLNAVLVEIVYDPLAKCFVQANEVLNFTICFQKFVNVKRLLTRQRIFYGSFEIVGKFGQAK